jgi:hypothetical protein
MALTVVLALAAAACGRGDSGNVMAAAGNALSPEQVDAALGPELANAQNQAEPIDQGNAAAPVTATPPDDAEEPDAPAAAETRREPEPEPETLEEPTEAAPTTNNSPEE